MATQTTNYHFPKYEADDLPNLLDEYNEFADLADAAINNAMMTATNAGTAAQNAKTAADAASAKVDDVEDTVGTLSAQVVTAQNTAERGLSLAQTNESSITGIETQLETANQSIASLQSGKAPTNHASSSSQYGAATASNYGHVRLTDVAGSQGASSSTAATPLAVQKVIDSGNSVKIYSGQFPTTSGNWTISGVNQCNILHIPLIKAIAISIHIEEFNNTVAGTSGQFTIEGAVPEEYRPSNTLRMASNVYALSGGNVFSSNAEVLPNGNVNVVASSTSAQNATGNCHANLIYFYGTAIDAIGE